MILIYRMYWKKNGYRLSIIINNKRIKYGRYGMLIKVKFYIDRLII